MSTEGTDHTANFVVRLLGQESTLAALPEQIQRVLQQRQSARFASPGPRQTPKWWPGRPSW